MNRAEVYNCQFDRDRNFKLVDEGQSLLPIEIKAGRTITRDYFKGVDYFLRLAGEQAAKPCIIYGGTANQERTKARVISWNNLDKLKT